MDIWRQPVAQVLEGLHSRPEGLAQAEALRRLQEFGPNRIARHPQTSLPRAFMGEFTHFFALILWLALALACLAEHFDPGQGMAQLAWAILGVILVNGSFSFWQAYKAERAMAALEALLPSRVRVWREGTLVEQAAEALVPGDILALEAGDAVPADCRVIEATGLRINGAVLTGESRPTSREPQPVEASQALDARNLVLAGATIVAGHGKAMVFATGMHTEFGRIARLTQTHQDTPSPLSLEINRVSRLVALLATALGLIFFTIGQAIGMPLWSSALFAVGIIVANVPEGLLPTVTLSLAMASRRMAQRNALVRHLPAVEALGATTVICTDKTGTLTENSMRVVRWHDGIQEGAGPPPAGLQEVAACCHNLRRTAGQQWLGDPMEIALQEWASDPTPAQPHLLELPFTAERRRMAVVIAKGNTRKLLCKGAPENLLPLCTSQRSVDSSPIPLDMAAWQARQQAMARRGLRVIAMASRDLADDAPLNETREAGLVLEGLVGLEDPPRPDVAEAIQRCQEAGIRIIMMTGDHPDTALAIAREIGLVRSTNPYLLRGEDIARMKPSQLQWALGPHPTYREILCARMGPEQKMLVVQALQARGDVVAVTGDGVNDAPALKAADIGIAMGQGGTDVAREAADMVLLDNHFASIVHAVEEGRAVYENLRKFLTYILTSNIPEIVPYLVFVLFQVPLPLTVIQILAVDLGTDMLPALALGAEPPHPEIMKRPPRPRHARLLDSAILARAYLFLGPLEAAAALTLFFSLLLGSGWTWGVPLERLDPHYQEATTACLATIVVMQMVNLFLCRDARAPAWSAGITANPLLLTGLLSEAAILVALVYTPIGQLLFGTAPLSPATWFAMLPMALAMFALEEGRKHLIRKQAASA